MNWMLIVDFASGVISPILWRREDLLREDVILFYPRNPTWPKYFGQQRFLRRLVILTFASTGRSFISLVGLKGPEIKGKYKIGAPFLINLFKGNKTSLSN